MTGNDLSNSQVTLLTERGVSFADVRTEIKQPFFITFGSGELWTKKNKIETWAPDDSAQEVNYPYTVM